jgi:hypothetical protein
MYNRHRTECIPQYLGPSMTLSFDVVGMTRISLSLSLSLSSLVNNEVQVIHRLFDLFCSFYLSKITCLCHTCTFSTFYLFFVWGKRNIKWQQERTDDLVLNLWCAFRQRTLRSACWPLPFQTRLPVHKQHTRNKTNSTQKPLQKNAFIIFCFTISPTWSCEKSTQPQKLYSIVHRSRYSRSKNCCKESIFLSFCSVHPITLLQTASVPT